MQLGTHMPGVERRKLIDIEDRILLHASALIVCLCKSLYYVLCIACFSRLQKKYQIFVLFLEVVTLHRTKRNV
jgi:hypothetical protein